MTAFATSILEHWNKTFAGNNRLKCGSLSLAVSKTLNPKRPAMILEMNNGSVHAVIRPEVAERLEINCKDNLSIMGIQERLVNIGVILHDPDYLFYVPAEAQRVYDLSRSARELNEADRAAFDIFYHEASEQDREDAFVELDHWAVVGCFDGDRLVSAASMCLWDNSPVADLGVLTLPDARGRGFARAAVQSISVLAKQRGYDPQYRCQLDNHASVALAKACGFHLFGKWIVAADATLLCGE